MSIANEITRLQNAKASIKSSIENKGVTVPSATTLDDYSTLIDSIPSGGTLDLSTGIKFAYSSFSTLPTTIQNANWSSVTNFEYMFSSCTSLTEIPQLNTSSGTSFGYMFNGCSKLTTIPQLNTSSSSRFSYMFSGCSKLTEVPQLNTSSGTAFSYMFNNCSKLTTISQIDTSLSTDCKYMFYNCSSLITIPELDGSSIATTISSIFDKCSNLTNFGGIKDLGESYWTTQSANNVNYKLNLSSSTLLTHESLMNAINKVYDIATRGCATQSLVLGSTNLAKLTAEEIAIATNKGWTVS